MGSRTIFSSAIVKTPEAKKRLRLVGLLTLGVASLSLLAATYIRIGGDEQTLTAARGFVHAALKNPDRQDFPIDGDRELLRSCASPKIDDILVIHAKLRYDFKLTCGNGDVAYAHVLMRQSPVAFVAFSRQDPRVVH